MFFFSLSQSDCRSIWSCRQTYWSSYGCGCWWYGHGSSRQRACSQSSHCNIYTRQIIWSLEQLSHILIEIYQVLGYGWSWQTTRRQREFWRTGVFLFSRCSYERLILDLSSAASKNIQRASKTEADSTLQCHNNWHTEKITGSGSEQCKFLLELQFCSII